MVKRKDLYARRRAIEDGDRDGLPQREFKFEAEDDGPQEEVVKKELILERSPDGIIGDKSFATRREVGHEILKQIQVDGILKKARKEALKTETKEDDIFVAKEMPDILEERVYDSQVGDYELDDF